MQERQFLHVIKTNLKIEQIPIHKIKYHEKNKELFEKREPEYIRELANNIQQEGLHEPISVKYDFRNDDYLCLSGEHRIEAVRLLGWTQIDGYKVNPDDELSYLIRRNTLKKQLGHKTRIKIYKEFCPEFLTCEKITITRLNEISSKTGIAVATLKSDLKKIRNGSTKDETIQTVIELWTKKKIKGLRVNLSGLSDENFILQVSGRNLNYEWRGKFKTVVKECIDAAKSEYFNKTFKNENLETAERIKKLRQAAGLTQFQLSQALGYSQSYLAEIESGKWKCSNNLFESIALFCQEKIV
ncbi:ParB N-terminal domain-containing protein (plasmid) [Leptospira weilii]|uniref:helix-turn-helix domain-containing protein n=1 Tax=Leptospira weilii TaxID=28184 RepID=UPI00201B5A80|nr:ParB N-terminal domain-containing protein [Leptospira weilii]UPY81102.1 ParB N-terminal domain-containing protein [Leptospira weilii]UPY81174.1 ParB N-terminal domain-containing protein [Leptospira weilii]